MAAAVELLLRNGVGGPYGLALSGDDYTHVVETSEHGGYPLFPHLRQILEGPLVWTPGIEGAIVVSLRGGDFLFESGQDVSVGYGRTTPSGRALPRGVVQLQGREPGGSGRHPLSPPMPPQTKVVAVATDGSAGASLAVEWAATFARSLEAELLAIQVVAPAPGDAPGEDADGGEPEAAPAHARLLEDLESSLPAEGLRSRGVVESGEDIAAEILAAAERADADVVVVGSSGMRGRKQFLLGNVANRVTHLADCTVVVVNTATGEPVADAEPDAGPLRARAREIAKALGPIGARQLSGRLLRLDGDPEGPRRLREAFEELGPTFGKLGQILSTRPDLMSAEYVDELAALQADVPEMSEAEVVAMMERELAVPWEDVFSDIDPEPLAAGTIAQVHRARMTDGHRVVVKVQRPEAEEVISNDLALLEMIVGRASRSRRLQRVIDLPSLAEQVSRSLRDELDFGEEARQHRPHGRDRRALRAHRRAELSPRALHPPPAGDGRGRRRGPAARGAAGTGAHRGRAPAHADLLQAGARGGLLPRRPAPGEHALGRRQDLAARSRHGRPDRRATRAASSSSSCSPSPRATSTCSPMSRSTSAGPPT